MCNVVMSQLLASDDLITAGKKLFDIMDEYASKDEKVIVDMESVTSLPSMFLNVSLGCYMDKYGPDSLKGRLSFNNITKVQVERIKDYISRYHVMEMR